MNIFGREISGRLVVGVLLVFLCLVLLTIYFVLQGGGGGESSTEIGLPETGEATVTAVTDATEFGDARLTVGTPLNPEDKEIATNPENGNGEDDGGFMVLVKWWNDTESSPPTGVFVVLGDQEWHPDPSLENASNVLGPVPLGEELDLLVYPDGREGNDIAVSYRITRDMESESERDAIHVEVRDDAVRVLGNPISNFDTTSER